MGARGSGLKEDLFGTHVPGVLLTNIFEYLRLEDLIRAERVCVFWYKCLIANPGAGDAWRIQWKSQEWCTSILSHKLVTPDGPDTGWRTRTHGRYRIEKNWITGRSAQRVLDHGDAVHAVCFKDKVLVTGGGDSRIKLWDLTNASCERTYLGHTDTVWALQLNGKLIVSGSADQDIKLWKTDRNDAQRTLTGHANAVVSLALRNDRLVSSSYDKTVKQWDYERGTCVRTFRGHTNCVWAVGLHEKIIVSGSADKNVKLWDIDSGACVHTFTGHKSAIHAIHWDGKRLLSGSADMSIRLWDIHKPRCLHPFEAKGIVRALSLEGKRIVAGIYIGTIKLWDAENFKCLNTMPAQNTWVETLQCDALTLISGDRRGQVRVWDFADFEVLPAPPQAIRTLSRDQDGKPLKMMMGSDSDVRRGHLRSLSAEDNRRRLSWGRSQSNSPKKSRGSMMSTIFNSSTVSPKTLKFESTTPSPPPGPAPASASASVPFSRRLSMPIRSQAKLWKKSYETRTPKNVRVLPIHSSAPTTPSKSPHKEEKEKKMLSRPSDQKSPIRKLLYPDDSVVPPPAQYMSSAFENQMSGLDALAFPAIARKTQSAPLVPPKKHLHGKHVPHSPALSDEELEEDDEDGDLEEDVDFRVT